MWHHPLAHQWTSTFLEVKSCDTTCEFSCEFSTTLSTFPNEHRKGLHQCPQPRRSVCVSAPPCKWKNPQQLPAAALATEINKSEMKHQLSSHFTSEVKEWVTFHHKGEQSFYPVSEANKRHEKMQMGTNLLLFWKRSSWFNRKCCCDYNGVWFKWCVHDHRLS